MRRSRPRSGKTQPSCTSCGRAELPNDPDLSQVLHDGKKAACQVAVASIAAARLERGEEPPSEDTGNYCSARAKLAPQSLKAISCEVAEELEKAVDPGWLWKDTHHAKLGDGFTFTMPDTPANQQPYPQEDTQQPGSAAMAPWRFHRLPGRTGPWMARPPALLGETLPRRHPLSHRHRRKGS